VTHKESGANYAVKCLDIGLINGEDQLNQLREEIFIMCQLDHPNIVRLEEVYESHSEIYLVQELCVGGELFDRLDEQPDYRYNEWECAKLVKQILCSVRYIHSKGIIHRDLKLENFLFSSKDPETSELKMIDFGLSKHFFQGEIQSEAVGTPYTVAPEVITGAYDERCDVWAIGVIAFLLLSGDPPFGGCGGPEPMTEVRQNIISASYTFQPSDIWDNVSDCAKEFIKCILVTDPSKRPNAWEAQQHKWITDYSQTTISPQKLAAEKQLQNGVINSLVQFKEYSDMRKLLCEVLSFTLLPEQISHLRTAFEKYDIDGSGEISLEGLKKVLMDNASDGSLGALTEDEIIDIFDAMRVRKSETKIHWHEFIAAGLSQCQVDERNLRLAFNRLDREHKGFITFDNVLDLMGADAAEEEEIRRMYIESLTHTRRPNNQINGPNPVIYYEDFLLLMKGQTRDEYGNIYGAASPRLNPSLPSVMLPSTASGNLGGLATLPELKLSPLTEENELDSPTAISPKSLRKIPIDTSLHSEESGSADAPEKVANTRTSSVPVTERERVRSYSFDDFDDQHREGSPPSTPKSPSGSTNANISATSATAESNITGTYHIALTLPEKTLIKRDSIVNRISTSSTRDSIMVNNRELYRAHRKMRLAVLDASKRFEEETARRILAEIKAAHDNNPGNTASNKLTSNGNRDTKPGLIMRRGTGTHNNKQLSSESVRKLLVQREKEHQKSLNEASKRGGRNRRQRVVSDLSSMMNSSNHQSRIGNNFSGGAKQSNDEENYLQQNSGSVGQNSSKMIGTSISKYGSLRGIGVDNMAADRLSLPVMFGKPTNGNEGHASGHDGNGGMLSVSSSDGNLVTLNER